MFRLKKNDTELLGIMLKDNFIAYCVPNVNFPLFSHTKTKRRCTQNCLARYNRDAAGLSQQELADRVGISKSYISSLELGYRAPSLNLLVKIAQTLEVNAGKMVDEMVEDAERVL